MVIEELLLSFREGSNVHDSVRFHSHSIQRWSMGNGRNDQYTGIFEADEPAIKKVVNRGSQKKSVLPVKPFLIIGISPRFAMAGSQTKQATLCAAKNAHELSPSGLFGVDGENHPFLNALGDNTFSGIVDATGHVASVFSGPDRPAAAAQVMADTVIGGVRQGIPGGGVLSKGLAGSALDFGVNAITKAAPIAYLAGTGAELAGEGLAGPVGWAKIGVDAGIFAGAFVYCATR
jgi:hypothetical protein